MNLASGSAVPRDIEPRSESRQAAAATDVGCVRARNEDSHGMVEALGLYVVCDGMGGAAGGEIASQMAVEALLAYMRGRFAAIDPDLRAELESRHERAQLLEEAILHANRVVYCRSLLEPELQGMGSTLVCAWFSGRDVLIANVGDSRAYLLRRGSIQQLTEDHSLLAEEVRSGAMTKAQAESSPLRSIITRALGTRERVEPDFFRIEAEPGDRFLLTSDGLLRHVDDATILDTASQGPPHEACTRLVSLALQGGGRDNITCILVQTP
ncbi:protein phosphatase [Granulicella rosea]|uniref:Protein phosphatase n=1 Tax=Granulicella rosea TaxID=474952 RepID=A0A239KPL3_9BACT|nr:Stp1/IreP family PP2C-type Ser/Thr phosphatase [Granulicella rosea]SNT19563.1 protein phosphatase [Granulicella rosea]